MAQIHAESGQVVSVLPLGDALSEARTTALLKAAQLEVVRIVLLAGKGMPPHQVAGEITVQCIEGRVEFDAHGRSHVLAPGDWLHVQAGEPHALRALSDASLLLTICLLPAAQASGG